MEHNCLFLLFLYSWLAVYVGVITYSAYLQIRTQGFTLDILVFVVFMYVLLLTCIWILNSRLTFIP